ncbi:MAG: HEAT repeat domain-containing protein [Rhodocyclaceae bacterium]|nr:HEAT repeat domain-containing protein [Rhodocyclaceae bacterium]
MGSSTLSDPYVAAAFWTGLGALLLTLLLSLQIIRLRILLRRRERRDQAVHRKWRPLLNTAIVGEMPRLPSTLPKKEIQPFLTLWLHLQFSLRGEAQEALNEIARRLHIDEIARRMLAHGNRAEKLSAVLVLGYMRDPQAWERLLHFAADKDNLLSLNAVWGALRINPEAGLQKLLPSLLERQDWAMTRVVSILQEVGEGAHRALTTMIPTLPPEHLPHALRLVEAMRVAMPTSLLIQLLRSDSPTLLVTALRCINTPEPLPQTRALLRHEDWRVRVQVAKALGRIGNRDDIAGLIALLQDSEWWVRYRAAQALTELPEFSLEDIQRLRNALNDRFAVDMLSQVMAERGLA